MMHKKPKLGFNLGAQLNAYVTDNFAFYVEPRFSIQPFDKVIAPTSHDKVQYATMLGVRYVHDRFYTKNNDAAYVDLWHGKNSAVSMISSTGSSNGIRLRTGILDVTSRKKSATGILCRISGRSTESSATTSGILCRSGISRPTGVHSCRA